MNYKKGNIGDYKVEKKGYITGAFFPPELLEHDTSIEINYNKLPDNFTASKHFHSKSKTWVIVTKGKMYFTIDGNDMEINEGEFVIFPAGIHEQVVKVEPNTEAITIHSPSIPGGDKENVL